jgi:hypothetical protein
MNGVFNDKIVEFLKTSQLTKWLDHVTGTLKEAHFFKPR